MNYEEIESSTWLNSKHTFSSTVKSPVQLWHGIWQKLTLAWDKWSQKLCIGIQKDIACLESISTLPTYFSLSSVQ